MILYLIIMLICQIFWSIVLIAAIIFFTVKGFKTKRRVFFIPVVAYFALWAICRISAEVELLDIRSKISASVSHIIFEPLPASLPDIIQVTGRASLSLRGRLREMGFRYQIFESSDVDAQRSYSPTYTRHDTTDLKSNGEIIESLPLPRLIFTSQPSLRFFRPESLIINERKAPHMSGSGPWEIIYIDEQGRSRLVAYHWEPDIDVPRFFPIPILVIPLIPSKVIWLRGGHYTNTKFKHDMMLKFLEAALKGEKGAWP